MPGMTPGGLPYPLPTEPIADGADAIKNLATAVETHFNNLGGLMFAWGRISAVTDANGLLTVPVPAAWRSGGIQVVGLQLTPAHQSTLDALSLILQPLVWDDVWPRPAGTTGIAVRVRREDTNQWMGSNAATFFWLMYAVVGP